MRALVNSAISDVSIKYRVSYDRVRGALNRYVKGEVDWNQFKHLRRIGLDEISLLKGHRDFVAIVSTRDDPGKPLALAALEDRKKETIVAFLKAIPESLRGAVREVCTDLYEGFINAAAEVLPHAKVVGDRFHVAKEVIELLFKRSRDLRKAYALGEKLTQIFDAKQTREVAQAAIQDWIVEVKRSGLNCFGMFIATLKEHMEIVTNYFTNRSNSGCVEGLNNKIKALKRRCYGIANPISLFRRVTLCRVRLAQSAPGLG